MHSNFFIMKNEKNNGKQEFCYTKNGIGTYEASYLTDLQIANAICNIPPDQSFRLGWLTFLLTERSLLASSKLGLLSIATRNKRTRRIVGFSCALPHNVAKNIPYLKPLSTEIKERFENHFIISVCVQKEFRNRGIGKELLRRVLLEVQLQIGGYVFAEVGDSNLLGEKFLMSQGFSSVNQVNGFLDRRIFFKPLAKKERNIKPFSKKL